MADDVGAVPNDIKALLILHPTVIPEPYASCLTN